MIVVLSLLNALAVSCSNVLGGVAARHLPLRAVFAIASSSALFVAVTIVVASGSAATTNGLLLGACAGIIGGIGVPLAYRAFAIGPVGVAGTIIACVSTGVIALVGMATGSSVTASRIIALVIAAGSVVLVSQVGRARSTVPFSGVIIAVLAGAAFGAFALIIGNAPSTDGWWPLVAARIGVVMVAVAFLLIRGAKSLTTSAPSGNRGRYLFAIGAGMLDVIGNLFLVLALREGDLLIVGILTSIAPILTATIGWIVFGERLTRLQVLGVVLAVGAVAIAAI